MKVLNSIIAVGLLFAIMSCGGGIGDQKANAEGFTAIEKELKSEFGDKAYYTDLTIGYEKSAGNIVNVTVTEDPESLMMGEWTYVQSAWKQNSEITLEVSEGSKAADFMFQLGETVSLSKLGGLVEESAKKLTAEKNIENPSLNLAIVKFPDDGDNEKAKFVIMLEPENGGTTYTFNYKLDGTLIDSDI